MAEVGHAVTHGASSHWLQRVTWNARRGLREDADVDVLHVGARDAERHLVLGLAGRGAGVAADAAGLVDDLPPTRTFGPGRIRSGPYTCFPQGMRFGPYIRFPGRMDPAPTPVSGPCATR